MKKSNFLFLLAFCSLLIISCNKSDRNNDHESASVIDNLVALNAVNDIYTQVMEAASQQTEFNKVQSQCYSLSVYPAAPDSTFPKILTIDYGASNCTDSRGFNHRGKLVVQFSNKVKTYNTSITLTFTDYFYNDMRISGVYTITNGGLNKANHLVYYIVVKDMHISANDQPEYIYYDCTYKKEWITGDTTLETADDVFYLTGSSNGINHVGNAYTAEIDSSLRFENSCKHFVSGTINIAPESLSSRKMDFGSGSCDGLIKYNINGFYFELVEN